MALEDMEREDRGGALQLESHDCGAYVRVAVPRTQSLAQLLRFIDTLAAWTGGAWRGRRLLVDLQRIDPPGYVEQVIVGEHAAQRLVHVPRIASVVKEVTGFSEEMMQRRGMSMRAFADEAEAVRWLTVQDSATHPLLRR